MFSTRSVQQLRNATIERYVPVGTYCIFMEDERPNARASVIM
jgi:hypothetical protein